MSNMRKKSSNSAEVKLFKLDYENVMCKLRSYAERIVKKGAVAVILIGSLARGDWTAYSDADIIVITNNLPKNPLNRIKQFIDPTLPIDVEPRAYMVEEILHMAKKRSRIIQEIIENGKLLAGDHEIIRKIKMCFNEDF